MRIAVSGAHRTGKSTLVDSLGRELAGHEVVEEPYHLLEEEGHEFGHPPSLEDFESQLDRSIRAILTGSDDQIFDRCPADLLAYLLTHRDGARFDFDPWIPRVRAALEKLDVVVFVPIEHPDRITLGRDDCPQWRRRVDEELRSVLLDDGWDLGARVLEVRGTAGERLNQVLEFIRRP